MTQNNLLKGNQIDKKIIDCFTNCMIKDRISDDNMEILKKIIFMDETLENFDALKKLSSSFISSLAENGQVSDFQLPFKNDFSLLYNLEEIFIRKNIRNGNLYRDHVVHSLRVGLITNNILMNNQDFWFDEISLYICEKYRFDKEIWKKKLFEKKWLFKLITFQTFVMSCFHDIGKCYELWKKIEPEHRRELVSSKNNDYFEKINNFCEKIDDFLNEKESCLDQALFEACKNKKHDGAIYADFCINNNLNSQINLISYINKKISDIKEGNKFDAYIGVNEPSKNDIKNISDLIYIELIYAISVHDQKENFPVSPFSEIIRLADNLQEWDRPYQVFNEEDDSVEYSKFFSKGNFNFEVKSKNQNTKNTGVLNVEYLFNLNESHPPEGFDPMRYYNGFKTWFGKHNCLKKKNLHKSHHEECLQEKIINYKMKFNNFFINDVENPEIDISFNLFDLEYTSRN